MEQTITTIIGSAFIKKGEKFLIAKRADDDTFYPGYWELAGGKIDFGESVSDGTVREIKEELGLDIQATYVLSVRHFLHEKLPTKQFIELFYYGEMLDPEQKVQLSHEHSAYEWVTFSDIGGFHISPYILAVIEEIKNHPFFK